MTKMRKVIGQMKLSLTPRTVLENKRLGRWRSPFAPPSLTSLPYYDAAFGTREGEAVLASLENYSSELNQLDPQFFLNDFFGPGDVGFYWQTIRDSRPDLIVEVGSGYSTHIAAKAQERNGTGRLICVDPQPRTSLKSLPAELLQVPIETVGDHLFPLLKAGDILFIDASHTAKEAEFYVKAFAYLSKGVHVHFHDIDYPWPRPDKSWCEDEVIHRFLAESKTPIRVFGSFLTLRYLERMRHILPQYARIPYRRFNALWFVTQ